MQTDLAVSWLIGSVLRLSVRRTGAKWPGALRVEAEQRILTGGNAMEPRAFLTALFRKAVAAADPQVCLANYLPRPPAGRTIVVGGGKAAASMAQALERAWQGPLEGTVVTRYGHSAPTKSIRVIEAAHPVPDEAGAAGARALLDHVSGLTPDDLVLCLMSGGASSLLTCPPDGITLEDKQALNRALLRCGADITQMNAVRKHLSLIKGGRLAAAAAPARVLTLAISDVPGDAPDVIGSGPTVPDTSTRADALAILDAFGIEAPKPVMNWLADPASETPKPGDPVFANCEVEIIAAPQMSLEAAARFAREQQVPPMILGDALEGEAREVGIVHAGIARQVVRHGQPLRKPAVLLSGGETTVTVTGDGRGGRNVEFLLGMAIALNGQPGVYAFAGDTDGIDGTEDNAGAIITPDTLARAKARGLDADAYLAANDAYSFFDALGDLVKTGPTLTNVNDFRAVLIV
jgi:glycerate 2-kinase